MNTGLKYGSIQNSTISNIDQSTIVDPTTVPQIQGFRNPLLRLRRNKPISRNLTNDYHQNQQIKQSCGKIRNETFDLQYNKTVKLIEKIMKSLKVEKVDNTNEIIANWIAWLMIVGLLCWIGISNGKSGGLISASWGLAIAMLILIQKLLFVKPISSSIAHRAATSVLVEQQFLLILVYFW